MAIYDVTQFNPPARSIRAGDVLNCPFSGGKIAVQLPPGTYTMTCWGAEGGSYDASIAAGGKGGKAYANVSLSGFVTCYLYAGGKGTYGTNPSGVNNGGFNGGGNAGYHGGTGGGGTDIRFGLDSVLARGIVAGGGGGAYAYDSTYKAVGGFAGAKTAAAGNGGYIGLDTIAGKGAADQTPGAGGSGSTGHNGGPGTFGAGGNTSSVASGVAYEQYPSTGAGGGGWYGGGAAGNYDGEQRRAAGGGGGNGFAGVSAWAGDAPAGYTLPNEVGIGSPYGISTGENSFTDPDGTTVTGHSGDGYIRIEVGSVDIQPAGPLTQLVVNNTIYLPQTTRDKYRCYPSLLSQQIEMITGRIVQEIRGTVQIIEYSYDYMGNELMRQLNEVLRSGAPFPVAYLPDGTDEMESSIFICTDFPVPEFAFSRYGVPYWHNVAFTLREVRPHA